MTRTTPAGRTQARAWASRRGLEKRSRRYLGAATRAWSAMINGWAGAGGASRAKRERARRAMQGSTVARGKVRAATSSRGWSNTNSGTGAGESAQPVTGSAAGSQSGGGPRAGAASAGRGKGARGQAAAEAEHSPPAERRAAMTWAQRLKRVITPVFPLLLRSARRPRQGSGCAHRATRSGSRRRRAGLAAGDALATAISATEVFNADRRALETTRLPCDIAFGLPLRFTWLSSQSIRG